MSTWSRGSSTHGLLWWRIRDLQEDLRYSAPQGCRVCWTGASEVPDNAEHSVTAQGKRDAVPQQDPNSLHRNKLLTHPLQRQIPATNSTTFSRNKSVHHIAGCVPSLWGWEGTKVYRELIYSFHKHLLSITFCSSYYKTYRKQTSSNPSEIFTDFSGC